MSNQDSNNSGCLGPIFWIVVACGIYGLVNGNNQRPAQQAPIYVPVPQQPAPMQPATPQVSPYGQLSPYGQQNKVKCTQKYNDVSGSFETVCEQCSWLGC